MPYSGNGVDEPAYCDPKGFAMMAARRPANAASVADVVTRTRGWRSGPKASYSSVSSMGSMDMADLAEDGGQEGAKAGKTQQQQLTAPQQKKASTSAAGPQLPTASLSSMAPPSANTSSAASSSPTHLPKSQAQCQLPEHAAAHSPSFSEYSRSSPLPSTSASTAALSSLDGSSSNGSSRHSRDAPGSSTTSSYSPATAEDEGDRTGSSSLSSSSSPMSTSALPRVGPTLSTTSEAFEWDSEDMSVLLRVETFQDRIAMWSSLYYQLLAAFAINGAFLASDCNLLASFVAAWLLRTGPLVLSELRARAAAYATM
ncbi:hypothetical protein Vretimale_9053 [Volvox reticuliferus]|uniref:Uncharacterized protein n=1 Tax=Volvox reticuliferus TaxID=1737510 RepID=A0A8J4GC02_9CHLO|nr:hypothetical protein Vretimale_9053 [Volvox reticuliferus]